MASAKKDTTQRLSFLSYNLYCLPGVASAFSPSSCPLSTERSEAFLEQVPSYDVLALQEVWDPRYKSIERYARLNNLHVVGSSAPSTWNYLSLRIFGGGLMIMSKYPIVDTQEIKFDKGSHSDKFVTKGVLYAKIKVDSSYVHVFNTHLQASYGHEFNFAPNTYASTRKKQLKKMAEFIQRVTSKDHYPILLAGDFNVNARSAPNDGSDSKEYTEMLELLHHESYTIVDILKEHNGGMHPETYAGNGVLHGEKPKIGGQRLDFIFQLKRESVLTYTFAEGKVVPFKATDEDFTHISDHYAQSVIMEIHTEDGTVEKGDGADLSLASIALA
jgi:endonuclease/exonuclease/phosphatase family metal-dependent hydrolase